MIAQYMADLEQRLMSHGVPSVEAHLLAVSAEEYVSDSIQEITNYSLIDAMTYAAQLKASEFIETAEVVDHGHMFEIRSFTGKTDFSAPARPMIPGLLKNPKVSKNGSLYKVVPISTAKSSFDRDAAINHASRTARELARDSGNRSLVNDIRSIYQTSLAHPKTKGGATVFRTVTSKQDPLTMWVYPSQERDMGEFLSSLNADMNSQVQMLLEATVASILARFE